MNNVITYSPATTIPLTYACANQCLYCGFRQDEAALLPFDEIQTIAAQAQSKGISEVLVMSGENADRVPSVKSALKLLGLASMVQWTKRVCNYLLELNLLPHINIGILDYTGLAELKEVSASMGLMMEGDYGKLSSIVNPQKDFSRRLQNLELAGQLKIPFTTGVLMGLGQSQSDRIRSIQAIVSCHQTYGHVQEIILQNYVPNRRSHTPTQMVSTEELKEIIALVKLESPDISLQIPPNLNLDWADLLSVGINDLGGIGKIDLVNRESPWLPVEKIAEILKGKNYRLRKRLPIYPKYYQLGWYSQRVGAVIEKWIQNDHEYRYYTE
jgi:FO synthase subunit 1